MTDLERAKAGLKGHSICLCRGEELLTDDGRGISPMVRFIGEGRELSGWSAADVIVGKAAAALFVKAGVSAVYGEVMSAAGAEYLRAHGVEASYGTLTERIMNRQGTGICPMEQAVSGIDDTEECCKALCERLSQMRKSG